MSHTHPLIRQYFGTPRARAVARARVKVLDAFWKPTGIPHSPYGNEALSSRVGTRWFK